MKSGSTNGLLLRGFVCLLFSAVPVWADDHKQAQQAVRRGEYGRAVEVYQQLIAQDPRDVRAHCGLAHALLKAGRARLAFPPAAEAVTLAPGNARARAVLGTVLLRLGNLPAAFAQFVAAVQTDGRNALAVAGLGEIDFYENRRRDSYEKLRLATYLDPSEPDFHYQLGQAASRFERFSDAADAYQRFLQLAPLKDEDRRDRLRAMIQFFRYIDKARLMQISGPGSTAVPIEVRGSRPHFDVMINGRGPFKFVLDSGASISVLSTEAARQLGINPIARGGRARGVGGGGSFEIIYGFLNNLTIGDVRIEGVPVFFRELTAAPGQPPGSQVAGYIGLTVMSKFLTTVDYQSRQLVLERGNGAKGGATPGEAGAVIEIPLRSTNNGLVSAETRLNSRESLSFIVDTGASVTAVAKTFADHLPAPEKRLAGYRATVIGAGGISEGVEVLAISELALANMAHKGINAPILDFSAINETSGFEQAGILGGDFLKNFRVTFDLHQMRLRLRPLSDAILVRPPGVSEPVQPDGLSQSQNTALGPRRQPGN